MDHGRSHCPGRGSSWLGGCLGSGILIELWGLPLTSASPHSNFNVPEAKNRPIPESTEARI